MKKIDVTGGAGGGLQNPFAALETSGLPEGPSAPPTVTASPSAARAAKRGRVVLRRETARRGGKAVVVVGDIPPTLADDDLAELARQLRKSCGCGGTVRGREIEIQGDQPAKVAALLEERGFRVAGVRA
ncbi:MAG: translation initiation factor [Verrucomicrobiales bacterium]|nr:translation initiation factor [Verrucomicrobiales bacterium]